MWRLIDNSCKNQLHAYVCTNVCIIDATLKKKINFIVNIIKNVLHKNMRKQNKTRKLVSFNACN